MNLASCRLLARRNLTGVWFRGVGARYIEKAIRANHTSTVISRFSAASLANPKYQILYFSQDRTTVLFERGAVRGDITDPTTLVSPPGHDALTMVEVHVNLVDIADLTDPEQADLIGTNAQELTGNWEHYALRTPPFGCTSSTHTGAAPTQLLGEALFESGFMAFVSFSAAIAVHKNLVVFPERLAGSACTINYEWFDTAGCRQRLKIP